MQCITKPRASAMSVITKMHPHLVKCSRKQVNGRAPGNNISETKFAYFEEKKIILDLITQVFFLLLEYQNLILDLKTKIICF